MSLKESIEKYITQSELIITKFNDKIVKFDKYRRGFNIIIFIGASVSAVSFIGIASARFPTGMSLGNIIIGSLTFYGASFADKFIIKNFFKETEKIAREYKLVENELTNNWIKIKTLAQGLVKDKTSMEEAMLYVLIEIIKNNHQIMSILNITSIIENYSKIDILSESKAGSENIVQLVFYWLTYCSKFMKKSGVLDEVLDVREGWGESTIPVIRSLREELTEKNIKVKLILDIYNEITVLSAQYFE